MEADATTLSLNEWAVLGLLAERPRHGYDIAAELRRDSTLGGAWRVTRPLVYRSLERLEAAGHAEKRRIESGHGGPDRTVYGATRRGRRELQRWLDTPVEHPREVRTALLLKLLLLRRLARDNRPLVAAQRRRFEALFERLCTPPEPGAVTELWRHHTAASIAAFLDAAEDSEPTET